MMKIEIESQTPEPVDDATKAAIQLAEEQFQRGEGVTLEEAQKRRTQRYKEWQLARQEVISV